MASDGIIKTDIKKWLAWKTDDYYRHIDYIRVYYIRDKNVIYLMRHIKEKKSIRSGDVKTIEYSIVCSLPGRVDFNNLISREHQVDGYTQRKANEDCVFNLFSSHAATLETLLELFVVKHGKELRFEYWPINNSEYKDKMGVIGETLIIKFYQNGEFNKKCYTVYLDNLPNADSTKMLSYDLWHGERDSITELNLMFGGDKRITEVIEA
jgi:hypothetical protein